MRSPRILRLLVAILGAGTMLFGLAPLIVPKWFAQLFGLPYPHHRPAASVAIRSVGVRDLVNGWGLLATLDDPARNTPWLIVRTASDSGDALATFAAALRERDNRRLLALGALAAGAAVGDAVLLAITRRRA